MADYKPETKVYLCEQVPLDDTYTDTMDFADKTAQSAYFAGKATHKYTNLSYQRVNNSIANPRAASTCRVPDLADNLYNCNYMMFQNNNFGTKWFYAFIKQVNYINPDCTEIVYEIDHFQTWLFDTTVGVCYVEREHSATDEAFENILPEPIDVTEYSPVRYYDGFSPDLIHTWYGVLATSDSLGGQPNFTSIGNSISGLNLEKASSTSQLFTILNEYLESAKDILTNNVANNVVSVYQCLGEPAVGGDKQTEKKEVSDRESKISTSLNGYTFKNNKILNSQFHFYLCATADGSTMEFKPEKIIGNYLTFDRIIVHSVVPIITYVPHYDGIEGNWNYPLSMSIFIQCPWATDTYTTWLHDNGFGLFAGLTTSLSQMGIGALSGDVGKVFSGIKGTLNLAGETIQAINAPDKAHGALFDKNSALLNERPELTLYEICADAKSLQRADMFMTKFGYTTNMTKVPNRRSRKYWNYIKVSAPHVRGSMPVEAADMFKKILTNGVTIWHDGNVGNYNRDNAVTKIVGW